MKRFAFLFPGQGSQFVGMLSELAQIYPVVQTTFSEASAVLNYDLWQLVVNGPKEALNQTARTQPALLTVSVALWRVWNSLTTAKPVFLAGHSLGEYSALVCANALGFSDAVMLVAQRGRLMQSAVPEGEGSMAAIIGLKDEEVADLCKNVSQGEVLSPANFNAIGQIVVSGNKDAVDRVVLAAKGAGAKLAMNIPVSVPSHCALMMPAAEAFSSVIKKIVIKPPQIPVINNVDVCVETDPQKIKEALIKQLYSPVRWVEIIKSLSNHSVDYFIECGPGSVLSGLNKRIVKELPTKRIDSEESMNFEASSCQKNSDVNV